MAIMKVLVKLQAARPIRYQDCQIHICVLDFAALKKSAPKKNARRACESSEFE